MKKGMNIPSDIDGYIAQFAPAVQERLQQIRALVHTTVPAAAETIRYGMPTFLLGRAHLVLFGAFKHHIGFYPVPNNDESFMCELEGYQTGKGSVQFPYGKPLPVKLITRIIRYNEKRLG